jgi:hypothetical protein
MFVARAAKNINVHSSLSQLKSIDYPWETVYALPPVTPGRGVRFFGHLLSLSGTSFRGSLDIRGQRRDVVPGDSLRTTSDRGLVPDTALGAPIAAEGQATPEGHLSGSAKVQVDGASLTRRTRLSGLVSILISIVLGVLITYIFETFVGGKQQ